MALAAVAIMKADESSDINTAVAAGEVGEEAILPQKAALQPMRMALKSALRKKK